MEEEAACTEDVRFVARYMGGVLLTSWSTDGPGTSPEAGEGEETFFGEFLLDYCTNKGSDLLIHEAGKGRLPRLFAKV